MWQPQDKGLPAAHAGIDITEKDELLHIHYAQEVNMDNLMEKFLIKNTTREQRERIIRDSLDCGGGGCENCSACGVYGAGDPYDMYQPYIDGEKELSEIADEFKANYLK